jgi:hypothetical protein
LLSAPFLPAIEAEEGGMIHEAGKGQPNSGKQLSAQDMAGLFVEMVLGN